MIRRGQLAVVHVIPGETARRLIPRSSRQRSGPILATAFAAAAMLLGCLLWPAHEHEQGQGEPITVVAARQGDIAPPARVGPEPARAKPMVGWLLGTWSQRDTAGNAAGSCDLPSAVTFRSDGGYSSPLGFGRYALDADHLLLWDRVTIDADAGEDRSHIAERTTNIVQRLSDTAMLRDGAALFRCDKASNNRNVME